MSNCFLKSHWYTFKSHILNLILSVIVQFTNLILNKKFVKPGLYYGNYLINSGIFPNKNKNYFKWELEWNKSYRLFNSGHYEDSIRIRNDVMHEIYNFNGTNTKDYFPPLLSKTYSGAFGHRGNLGVHIGAQKLGLVPNGQRFLEVNKNQLTDPFFMSITNDIKIVPDLNNSKISDPPPGKWHLYEKMQLIKCFSNFVDQFQLKEIVFKKMNGEKILCLDPEYELRAASELKKLGIGINDWFVTLHVRQTADQNEHNYQPISTYMAAIKFITSVGGKVIRIGDNTQPPLPNIKNVIDLTRHVNSASHLHYYALANAKFFLGTPSGPSYIPPLFNVPVLLANLTFPALNSPYYSNKTIYIPKRIYARGRLLSLNQLLNSNLGFASFSPKQLRQSGISLEWNHEIEILDAAKEMIETIFNGNNIRNLGLDSRVQDIRNQIPFATGGLFGTKWLEKNEYWYLKE